MIVLAIDPGHEKCGIAVVEATDKVLYQAVVSRSELVNTLESLKAKYQIKKVILGDRTGAKALIKELFAIFQAVTLIDEHLSTNEGKLLYFKANPPKGWRKLIPIAWQEPPIAYDDYVAVVLARRFLSTGAGAA